jgi:hypothetical protein
MKDGKECSSSTPLIGRNTLTVATGTVHNCMEPEGGHGTNGASGGCLFFSYSQKQTLFELWKLFQYFLIKKVRDLRINFSLAAYIPWFSKNVFVT